MPAAELIKAVRISDRPVLALDSPSGLDTTSGIPGDPSILATATLTLALPKTGLIQPTAREYIGDLYVADIGVPPALYKQMDIKDPLIFNNQPIFRIALD